MIEVRNSRTNDVWHIRPDDEHRPAEQVMQVDGVVAVDVYLANGNLVTYRNVADA